ncbi:MAG: MCE family protein [Streptosporangiales bacterium]|nr:MCE family protein [Streptosporangiales bacterium]
MIELDPPESAAPAAARARPRPRRRLTIRRRRQVSGGIGLGVVVGIIALVIMAYNQVFSPGVPATVISARAGLLMSPGADVTLDGVTVGRVTSITPDGDQARLAISLLPGKIHSIPANVRASIQAPTIFGPKYLGLVMPARPVTSRVRADEVIEPTADPTEMDTAFASLVSVLNSVHPAKLAAALGAISTALRGQGTTLGNFVVQTNDYVRQLNPSLPAVSADLRIAPQVLSTFSAAAPDLIKSLGNLRTTSGTLVSQQAQFDAFLLNMTGLANTTDTFLAGNEQGLNRTLATLLPTGNLLAEYSPEFPCLFASINKEGSINASATALAMDATFLPGVKPYTASQNLPVTGATGKPSCYGGPLTTAQAARWPLIRFNDGTQNFFSRNESLTPGSPPLAVRLFGDQGAGAAANAARNGRNH